MAKISPSKAARRRARGVRMLQKGMRPTVIARELGVSRQTVQTWKSRLQSEDPAELVERKPPGRRFLLDEAKLSRLRRELKLGPSAHGFPDDRWTRQRIADLIAKIWQLKVARSTVSRYLDALGLTPRIATWNAKRARQLELAREGAEVSGAEGRHTTPCKAEP